jgi:hypothetical protein
MQRPSYLIFGAWAVAALLSALAAWESATGGLSNGPVSDVLFPDLRAARARQRQLGAEVAAEQARRRQVDELDGMLAAGHLSLLDGASRLRELHRGEPESVWVNVCRRFPNASDEERYCRLLIGDVEAYLLAVDRPRAPAIVARLEHELREHLRRGTLLLPEVGRADLGTVAVPLAQERTPP